MTAPSRTVPAPPPALQLTLVPTPQPPGEVRPVLRLVRPGRPLPLPVLPPGPRPSAAPSTLAHDEFGPVPTGRAELPPAGAAARRLVTIALEALAGRRPLAQVQPLASTGVYAALSAGRRPRWCTEGNAPVVIGPVRVCEPVDGVAEVSAVAHRAGRAHAVAARLEGMDGRWRCTALQIG
ncbi:Rv3235 family protein [Blastococcus sp. BMG 814]|uniref:Rv3235 family protein n=1 Tax=Blastococcus carthaginiensis TaxID=3050034 RepID=A0ABT9IB25_9ACTN|nr:Rv3235 family protein [Blastococcus carthaginiensis]MDP5182768.1 Rv3235 family protein [Blastococcus carthaginiensis]